ncbi:MAG: copper-translocating P-type ATPase [Phycisphaerales bacterium]|nr:MAG: copper-translocating P-type ATPase [Phycisphaerales bacterium]
MPPTSDRSAPSDHATLRVTGMHCATCVAGVERALRRTPGVRAASVNLAAASAAVETDPGIDTETLAEAIRKAGYDAETVDLNATTDDHTPDPEHARLRRNLTLAAVCTAPLVVIEMGGHLVPAFHHAIMGAMGERPLRFVLLTLAAIVQFGSGRRFYTTGLASFRRLAPDMNALVMLGTSAAFAYSALVTIAPALLPEGSRHVYFEASAVIITLVLLGRHLEASARGRTSGAIRALLKLRPATARVRRDGRETDLPAEQLRVGDEIVVRPGERIAADAEVIEGEAFVDESMLTGEPEPQRRTPGDRVVGGTVAQSGSLIIRATGVGRDTVLSQVVRTVREAQAAKLPIQTLVDRVTSVFVPVVIVIAAITFIVWQLLGPEPAFAMAVSNAVAVLIIACPCAMGLATPTSIMVATGRGATLGVLFRRGDALQRIASVQGVLLDKTGTLTAGAPSLTDVVLRAQSPHERTTEHQALRLAASVETRSEHPLARAVVAEAESRGLALSTITAFESRPARGVRARVEGAHVSVGSAAWLRELGIDPDPLEPDADRFAAAGKTPVFVAIGANAVACFAISDPLKPDAEESVRTLHAMRLTTELVTGDRERTARAIAGRVGISRVRSEVLPEQKAEAVRDAQRELGPVAFVGDGINDAPALATADVGIAIAAGTDVAIESADVVLIAPGVMGVPRAIRIGRATMRNIRQNLFWAFAYNAALIPVAAGVLYPLTGWLLNPMLAAGAMSLSSVSVVANALRLRRVRI